MCAAPRWTGWPSVPTRYIKHMMVVADLVSCDAGAIEDVQPADVVASYAADPSNAPAWYENIVAVRWETEPLLCIGSRVAFTARFLGRPLAYTYEITEYVPAERLVMRTAQGTVPDGDDLHLAGPR